MFIVEKPSGVNIWKMCLLGSGKTKAEAMTDAYGPKPWPKSAKTAIVREVTEEEFEKMSEY